MVLRVLVVDDEPGMRLGVQRALRSFTVDVEEEGTVAFDVVLVETGEAALSAIDERCPDLVLLDHKLPGISGLDVLAALGDEVRRDMLTVMMTAYASLETAVAATKRGAHDYLAKPFTPNELKAVVATAARHLLLQRRARRLADEKRRVRFEFVSVLAHELKAPIGAIEGFLRLIRERTAGEDLASYDRYVDRSLARLDGMRKLIFDLLDMTRIESGEKVRTLVEVDLADVVGRVVETLEPTARERGIAITVEGAAGQRLRADPAELEIVFNNLVSNAVKYNRPDGRVTVRVEPDEEGWLRCAVVDTGIGLTVGEQAQLFQEFKRIKNAATRDIPGSGLGLSTVRKLCQLYGGDVTVTSEAGVGSTFVVRLPRQGGAVIGSRRG